MRLSSSAKGLTSWSIVLTEGMYIDCQFCLNRWIPADAIEIVGLNDVRLVSTATHGCTINVGAVNLTLRNFRLYTYMEHPSAGITGLNITLSNVKLNSPFGYALRIEEGSLLMKDCAVSGSEHGVAARGARVRMEDCYVSDVHEGIHFHYSSFTAVKSRFLNVDKMTVTENSRCLIERCRFERSRAETCEFGHTHDYDSLFLINNESELLCEGSLFHGHDTVSSLFGRPRLKLLTLAMMSQRHNLNF